MEALRSLFFGLIFLALFIGFIVSLIFNLTKLMAIFDQFLRNVMPRIGK